MNETIPHGVLADSRPPEEKEKDHLHEDRFSGLPVVWVEKSLSDLKLTMPRDQDGSFSCVKQSTATVFEILIKKSVSAATYQLRKDKTQGGMELQNCGDIDYNQGATYESTTPSQRMNDPQMDAIVLPTLTLKSTGYRTFYNHDIDKVAEAIQAYGQCVLCFHSSAKEWKLTPVYLGDNVDFGHAICGVDFLLINGVKTIACMDSAGKWSSPDGLRLITEDFLNKRCIGAMYYLGAKIVEVPPPVVPPTTDLSPKLTLSIWQQFVAILRKLNIIPNA